MEGGVVDVRKPGTWQNPTELPTYSLTHPNVIGLAGGQAESFSFPTHNPITRSFSGDPYKLGISRYTVTGSLSWAWET